MGQAGRSSLRQLPSMKVTFNPGLLHKLFIRCERCFPFGNYMKFFAASVVFGFL